jgi:hypothetical protein
MFTRLNPIQSSSVLVIARIAKSGLGSLGFIPHGMGHIKPVFSVVVNGWMVNGWTFHLFGEHDLKISPAQRNGIANYFYPILR